MKKKLLIALAIITIILIALYQIPRPKADFFENYKGEDKASDSLKEFQSRSLESISVDGLVWNYFSGGQGTKTILFMHGMGGAYDLWWQQINALVSNYKIITYSLPEEIDNLAATQKGIEAILAKENVDHFYAIGTSMGGYIGQYLLRNMPERIDKLILGNTFPPNDLQRAKNAKTAKLVAWLPEILVAKSRDKKAETDLFPAGKNHALLRAFLPSLPFSKKGFIGRYNVVVDNFTTNASTYQSKRIPKLIIESDNDPLVEPELRAALKSTYPEAEVFTFHNEGHFPYINAAEEYNTVISAFFAAESEVLNIENVVLNGYFEARRAADIPTLKKAFYTNAKLYTQKEKEVLEISLTQYLNTVQKGGPQEVKTSILDIDIVNNIAHCKTKFEYSDLTYIDYLMLVKNDQEWKIVSKSFSKL